MTALKTITLSAELAELKAGEDRRISGYASAFGNENCYGFSIAQGAFSELLADAGKLNVPMFFNHDTSAVPIGKWESLAEDDRGLVATGVLTPGISLSDDVYTAVKAGTVSGLSVSIGWYAKDFNEDTNQLTRVRELSEISVCTFPADTKARITEALSAELAQKIDALASEKDFEAFLRDEGGFSNARAKHLLSRLKACLNVQRDADQKEAETREALAALRSLNFRF